MDLKPLGAANPPGRHGVFEQAQRSAQAWRTYQLSSRVRSKLPAICHDATLSDTTRPLGIFHSAGRLQDSGSVEPWAGERIDEICTWFNFNLPSPRLKRGGWRAIFWFRSECRHMVQMLWELAAILEEHGVFVELIAHDNPGMIIYNDEFQVAAIPGRRKLHDRK